MAILMMAMMGFSTSASASCTVFLRLATAWNELIQSSIVVILAEKVKALETHMSSLSATTADNSRLLLLLFLLRFRIHQRLDVLRLFLLVHFFLLLVQFVLPRNRLRPNGGRLVRQVAGNQVVRVVEGVWYGVHPCKHSGRRMMTDFSDLLPSNT